LAKLQLKINPRQLAVRLVTLPYLG